MEEGEHVDETEAFEKDDVEDPGNCDQDPGEISLKKKTHSKPRTLTINLSACKYNSVRRVAKRFGFKVVDDQKDPVLFWSDCSMAIDKAVTLKPYQKVNHFPGMNEICRKDSLARNMNRMTKLFPKDYNYSPRSWCLPSDNGDLQAYGRMKKGVTYILKPDNSAQGRGISVIKNTKDIKTGEHMVCQQYISKPFLLDGYKFDLRIYVLVLSCDPLRIFVYKDGLVRLATTKYKSPTGNNISDVYMHLTNYAINKHSDQFVVDEDSGSKRRITTLDRWFEENGFDLKKIWKDIEDTIIKTLISCQPVLKHNYRSCFPHHVPGASACFEILGFDVMLDHKLKPWLLEVNLSPSFHTDSLLDKEIKEGLLFDTLNLINWKTMSKHKCQEELKKKLQERLLGQHKVKRQENEDEADMKTLFDKLTSFEDKHMGGFRRIYPQQGNEAFYKIYFQQGGPSLCNETAASRARQEEARLKRMEIESKQKSLKMSLLTNRTKARPESSGKASEFRSRVLTNPKQVLKKMTFHIPGSRKPPPIPKGPLPVNESVLPIADNEEDEIRRIAEMQKRDSLIRGLGIPEMLQYLLSNESLSTYNASQLPVEDSNLVGEVAHSNHAMVKETKECSQLPLSVQDKGHSRISELLPKDFIKRQLRMIPYQHSSHSMSTEALIPRFNACTLPTNMATQCFKEAWLGQPVTKYEPHFLSKSKKVVGSGDFVCVKAALSTRKRLGSNGSVPSSYFSGPRYN